LTSEAAVSAATSASTSTATREALALAGSRRFETAPHNCFACGQLNSHGLHLDLHTQADCCWTELSLPVRFEGWEGIAHGGIICTVLDEVMAWSIIDRGLLGMTARISVAFRRPIPIDIPTRVEGWVLEAGRRLIDTAGRVIDGRTGETLATAEARYAGAPEERQRELRDRYRIRVVADGDGISEGDTADTPDGVVAR
jgi:thioesterase superfamily protein